MLKRFRKGAGEFIGYSISILFLTIFYIIILNSLILNNAENVMEECILSVGRKVVICDSLEQAQERVQDAAEYYLERETRVIDHSSIQATVDYAPGYESKDHVWKKGKFIQVTVTADVHGFTQWFKKPKTVRCIMMIENGGESS